MLTLLSHYKEMTIRYILLVFVVHCFSTSIAAMKGMIVYGSTDKPIASVMKCFNAKQEKQGMRQL